jgi:prolipoprotein diacylglyceryltransferase
METHLIIAANGPWFQLFYNLAFLIASGILIYEGYRRKFPMLKWIFLIAFTHLLFITGTRLVAFTPEQWHILFTRFTLPVTTQKSLLGGLLFGFAGLIAGRFLLGIKQNITDAFAFSLPAGIAVQKIGCFLTGCCFGKASEVSWAVQYPANTLPHYHQFNDNLLTYSDAFSLPVHPVQLYELTGLLLCLAVLFHAKSHMKRPGSLFLLSLILIFAVRVFSEFFRDVHAHAIGGAVIGIFNATQLILLPVILLLVFFLLKRERSSISPATDYSSGDSSLPTAFSLLFLLTFIFSAFSTWFDFSEKMVMSVTLTAAFGFLGWAGFRQLVLSKRRWLYLSGFILPFILMSQALPVTSKDSVLVQKYKSLKVGFASGNFDNSYNIGIGDGCDRVSKTEYFKQEYVLGAVALDFTEIKPDKDIQLSYGGKIMMGRHRETRLSDQKVTDTNLFGITPYATYETKWVGMGGGLHVGNLSIIRENQSVDGSGTPNSGSIYTNVYPQLYCRIGPYRWFFVDYHFAEQFPSALPGFRHQIGIGTGFGLKNLTSLRIGSNIGTFSYLAGYFPIQNKVVLEPMFLWGTAPINGNAPQYQYSLGLSYRFGHKEVKKPYKPPVKATIQ